MSPLQGTDMACASLQRMHVAGRQRLTCWNRHSCVLAAHGWEGGGARVLPARSRRGSCVPAACECSSRSRGPTLSPCSRTRRSPPCAHHTARSARRPHAPSARAGTAPSRCPRGAESRPVSRSQPWGQGCTWSPTASSGPRPAERAPGTGCPEEQPQLSLPGHTPSHNISQPQLSPSPDRLCAPTRPMSHTADRPRPLKLPPPHLPCSERRSRPRTPAPPVPVPMQVHAAHCGRVPVQRVHALARVCIPHFEGPVGGAADDNAVPHLGRPHPPCVANQGLHTLQRRSLRPGRIGL